MNTQQSSWYHLSIYAKNPVPEAKRTIAQSLEQIYANSEWLKRDRKKLEKFLSKMVY